MQSTPEGTGGGGGRRLPRVWLLLIAAVFVVYLGLRLVQGVVWLVQHA
jgi:hypothetical protein